MRAEGERVGEAKRIKALEAALIRHGYGAGLCQCELCAALGDSVPWDSEPDPTAPQPPLASDPEWSDLPQEC